MPAKLTPEKWISLAQSIWGKRYDYSNSRYINSKKKLTVICSTHGPWRVIPSNHTHKPQPRGCPACGKLKQAETVKKDPADFVSQAKTLHGNRYNYGSIKYKNAKTPVEIICRIHGTFKQSPDVHLRGAGCPKCSVIGRINQVRAESALDVSKRISKRSKNHVTLVTESFQKINRPADFVCDLHGQFSRLVNTALHSKNPCIRCSMESISEHFKFWYTTDDIKARIARKFGTLYKISEFVYEGKNTPIKLTCIKHGEFSIQASSLQKSPGCPSCARKLSQAARNKGLREKVQSTKGNRAVQWLKKAREKHGKKYKYSEVEYIDAKTPVIIRCPKHGAFKQIPDTHLMSGCRACADEELLGLYSEKYFRDYPERAKRKATLYYIKFLFEDERFFKVGITTSSLRSRFGTISLEIFDLHVIHTRTLTLREAFQAEQAIQSEHGEKFRYRPKLQGIDPKTLRIGPTECFSAPLSTALLRKYFS